MQIQVQALRANQLKAIMQRMKWTQAELASLLGVGQKTISYWVREFKIPSLSNQRKIEIVYHTVMDDDLTKMPNAKELVMRILAERQKKEDEDDKAKMNGLSERAYFKNKGYVYELEKNNNSKIYLFPSMGKNIDMWYKVGGKSLLFYKYLLMERLGRNTTTRTDRDTTYQFRYGIGSVRRGDLITKQCREIGLKAEMLDNGVIIIELGKNVSPREINELVEREKKEQKVLENILEPKHNYPALIGAIRNLSEYMPIKVQQMKAVTRDVVGSRLITPTIELFEIYQRLANGRIRKTDAKQEMLNRVDDIAGVISFIDNSQILELKARVRMGQNLLEVRHQIEEVL